MARPQRGTHRFTEEPAPALSVDRRATSSTPRLASCHPDRSSRRDPRVAVRVIRIEGRLSRLRSARKACGRPSEECRAGQSAESRQSCATPVDRMSRKRGRTHGGGNAKLGRIEAQTGAAPAVSCRGRNQHREPGLGPESGLYPGEPETCRRSLRPFLRNFIYLALLLAVFKVYRIEERAFQGRAFQMLVTLALAALPVALSGPVPLEEARLRGGLDGGLVLDLRHPGRGDRARLERDPDRDLLPADPLDRPRRGRRRGGRRPGRRAGRARLAPSSPTTSGPSWHRCSCSA